MSVDRPRALSRLVTKLREDMDATAEAGMKALELWDPKAAMEERERIVKAKAKPSWRFWGLYAHVGKMETLRAAYEEAQIKTKLKTLKRTEAALRLTPGKGIEHRARVQPTPPHRACFLLDLFLVKADRKVIPGDLVEEFTTSILPKYGARRARFWFWVQTVRTIATRNAISRLILVGGLQRLVEWIFRGA
jgi:hypothetical protein